MHRRIEKSWTNIANMKGVVTMKKSDVQGALVDLISQAAENIEIDNRTGNQADRDYNSARLDGYLEIAGNLGLNPQLEYTGEPGKLGDARITGVTLGGDSFGIATGSR
jgi:hypothetical protein